MKHISSLIRDNKAYILFWALYTLAFILAVSTLSLTLPVLLGLALGLLTKPVCAWLERRPHLSRRKAAGITAFLSYLLVLSALAFLLFWLLRELPDTLAKSGFFRYDDLLPEVRAVLDAALDYLPQLPQLAAELLPQNFMSVMPVLNVFLKTVLYIPAVLLALVLIPMTAYFVLSRREMLPRAAALCLGEETAQRLRGAVGGLSNTSGGFLASYLLIYAMTFCESFIILSLLNIRYPLLTACIVTVSDVFPIFGPGTVLLPICAYQLLCGNFLTAAGLFIGWLLFTIIRQIVEPRLVSRITRTPPLWMLLAVYLSFVTGNFWLILYAALYFVVRSLFTDAEILQKKKAKP